MAPLRSKATRKATRLLAPALRRRAVAGFVLSLGLAVHGCAGPPWYLGEPLGGVSAIPPTSRALTVAEHRRAAEAAGIAQDRVAEIAELIALEQRGALRPGEERRLVELLTQRTHDWAALGRPLPLAEDLRHIVALWPSRAQPLAARLRAAERASGDLWLALGENARAEQEYRDAEKLGAEAMDFRFRAVWGAPVADLDRATIDRAMAQLPERVLAPFTVQYLDRGGAKPRLLRRAWMAAQIFGPPALLARLEASPVAPRFEADPAAEVRKTNDQVAPSIEGVSTEGARTEGVSTAGTQHTRVAPAPADLVFSGPTLARALIPLASAFPEILDPGPRSRVWSERLVTEDPTSPDSLEIAAIIDARAGRVGGAEQKLGDLVFFSPDRAGAYERAARVWEREGQPRRACAAWDRATRVGPVDDRRWCDLLACLKRDPRAGDADAEAAHVRARAPGLACVSVAVPERAPAALPDDAGGGGPAGGVAPSDPARSDGGAPLDGRPDDVATPPWRDDSGAGSD